MDERFRGVNTRRYPHLKLLIPACLLATTLFGIGALFMLSLSFHGIGLFLVVLAMFFLLSLLDSLLSGVRVTDRAVYFHGLLSTREILFSDVVSLARTRDGQYLIVNGKSDRIILNECMNGFHRVSVVLEQRTDVPRLTTKGSSFLVSILALLNSLRFRMPRLEG